MNNLIINQKKTIKNAIKMLNYTGAKCLVVVDNYKNKKFLGTLSDGDIRRALLKKRKLNSKIENIYNKNSKYILDINYSKITENKFFKKYKINILPILNKSKIVKRIIKLNFYKKNIKKKIFLFKKKKLKNCLLFIVAGGLGTRLEPITNIFPKALMPMNNKTILENIINNFNKYGIKKIFISLNYKAELIKAYFSKLKQYRNLKFITENYISGTVGGLRAIKNQRNRNIFISNCDIIVNCDYSKLLEFHELKKNDLTIVAVKKKLEIPYGVCDIDKNNELLKFREKPIITSLINSGLYIIKSYVINDFFYKNKKVKYDMNEFIRDLIFKKKKIGVFNINQKEWQDIGQMKEYKKNIGKLSV